MLIPHATEQWCQGFGEEASLAEVGTLWRGTTRATSIALRTLGTVASQPVSDHFLPIPCTLLNLLDVSVCPVTEFVSSRCLSRAYSQCWDHKPHISEVLPWARTAELREIWGTTCQRGKRRCHKHFLPPPPWLLHEVFWFWSHLGGGGKYMLLGGRTFWLKSVCVAGNKPRALHLRGNHFNTNLHPLAFGFLRQDLATQPWLALNL